MSKFDYKKYHLKKLLVKILVFIFFLIISFLFAKAYLSSFVYYDNQWFYAFLSWANRNQVLLIAVMSLSGILLLLGQAYLHTLKLTDEVYDSLDKVLDEDNSYIYFSQNEPLITKKINEIKMNLRKKEREASENEQRKNELIMYLAHDIKTPLTSIIGFLAILKDEHDLSKNFKKKYLNISYDKALRLEELTNEFFDITRFNLNNMTLQKNIVDYGFMTQQILSEFYPLLKEKKLTFKTDIEKDLFVSIDGNKIERVLDNIIRNAIIYAFPSTSISVNVFKKNKQIWTHIENKGPDIPPKKLERIFDEFFRMDASRSTDTQGAGLGLAIAKNIVISHGGYIEAISEDNKIGITFQLNSES